MASRHPITEQLLRVGPHGNAHWVALRAVVTVAVPLLMLVATDRLSWALYVGFGAFVSLYGRASGPGERLRMQARVGALIVAVNVVGVAVAISPHRSWWIVPVATVVAGLGAGLSDRDQWHPPGPLFLVFALCACASVPSTSGDLVPALLVTSATVAFALVVGSAVAVLRRGSFANRSWQRAPVEKRHVVRAMVAVALAGTIATTAQVGHPYWAMVSAAVPLAARHLEGQLVRAIQRIVGTGLGLATAGLLLWLDLPTLALVAVIVALQGAAELLIGRNYALALVAITPLALLMVSLVSTTPTGVLLRDRGLETVIGVVVGVAVGWFTRRRSVVD